MGKKLKLFSVSTDINIYLQIDVLCKYLWVMPYILWIKPYYLGVFFLKWFLDHMAEDDWWPQQILIKCPNQVVRQVSTLKPFPLIQQWDFCWHSYPDLSTFLF